MAINGRAFWDQFNTGYDTGKKIWQADSDRRRDADLANAAKLDQTVGRDMSADESAMAVTTAQGLQPGQTFSWDEASGSYVSPDGQKFATSAPKYTLGGLTQDKSFTPQQISNARRQSMADVYSQYGQVDKADELALRGQQMELGGLQLDKMRGDLEFDDKFQKAQQLAGEMTQAEQAAVSRAQQLLAKGDRVGAFNAIAEYRNKGIPDQRFIGLDENGQIVGWDNGKNAMSELNVHNPGVVEKMIGEVKGSTNDHILRMIPAKNMQEFVALQNLIDNRDKIAWDRNYTVGRDAVKDQQWGAGHALEQQKLLESIKDAERKYGLQASELALKGMLTGAQINAYNASANKDNQIGSAYSLSSKNITYGNDGTAVTFRQSPDGGLVAVPVMMQGGGQFKGSPKSVGQERTTMYKTPKEAAETAALVYPDWDTMPGSKRQEILDGMLGGQQPQSPMNDAPPGFVGSSSATSAPVVRPQTGLRTPSVSYSDYQIQNMNPVQAQRLYDSIASKSVQTREDGDTLARIRQLRGDIR